MERHRGSVESSSPPSANPVICVRFSETATTQLRQDNCLASRLGPACTHTVNPASRNDIPSDYRRRTLVFVPLLSRLRGWVGPADQMEWITTADLDNR